MDIVSEVQEGIFDYDSFKISWYVTLPLVVGLISDLLAPALGVESLRWAMSMVIIVSIVSTTLFFVAAKKMVADLKLTS